MSSDELIDAGDGVYRCLPGRSDILSSNLSILDASNQLSGVSQPVRLTGMLIEHRLELAMPKSNSPSGFGRTVDAQKALDLPGCVHDPIVAQGRESPSGPLARLPVSLIRLPLESRLGIRRPRLHFRMRPIYPAFNSLRRVLCEGLDGVRFPARMMTT